VIHHDARTPDGRLLHFDDLIATGDLVYDRGDEQRYLVGLDQGDQPPLLHPIGDDEHLAYWNELRRRDAEHRERLFAAGTLAPAGEREEER
jgi:hypothetical protein